MEIPNSKQQQLTFDKGITNVPSDAICSDNALEEEMGMYYADGEHRPIQKPEEYMTVAEGQTVLYVHKLADVTNYIVIDVSGNIKAGFRDDNQALSLYNATLLKNINPDSLQVTSLGKTLIVNDGDEIKYFLWSPDSGKYGELGAIPDPDLYFRMSVPSDILNAGTGNQTTGFVMRGVEYGFSTMDASWFSIRNYGRKNLRLFDTHQEDYDNAAIGSYSQALRKIESKKGFANPFVLRFAIELYDGTYTNLSAPILMFPSITKNAIGFTIDGAEEGSFVALRTFVHYSHLQVSGSFDYKDYSDIVKGVTLFVSESVPLYDTTGSQEPSFVDGSDICWDSLSSLETETSGNKFQTKDGENTVSDVWKTSLFTNCFIQSLNRREEDEILKSLKDTSIFYKISELGRSFEDYGWSLVQIGDHVLENLTTQEQLTDDYYSHSPKSASYITTYNNRLLLAGVKRGFFKGFTSFMPYQVSNNTQYAERWFIIKVWIKTDSGTRIVSKWFSTSDILGKYFFYPDPRAFKAQIFMYWRKTPPSGYYLLKEVELKEHPFLNGAYYFEELPDGTESLTDRGEPYEDTDDTTPEYLYNQIFNSEVNNPFVFKAIGNVTTGTGKILALTTITHALSQGQFGQYPIVVLTDEGIVAASVNGEGIISAVHPMSREVLNNPKSVTQTDGNVFFSSEKGLMVVVGSEVKCISEQLSGKSDMPFQTYLKKAYIAYDYRDSMLWIFNGSKTCYLYSVKSGTFSRYTFRNAITNVVNKYPDFLLQAGTQIFSLLERKNINIDEDDYTAQIITRPMKLENAFALKKLVQIMHVHQMEGSLSLRIFASNNLKREANTWVELHSLLGTPWKYYKLQYDFTGLKATDRFAGTVVVTTEERTNKLR